MDKDMTPIQAYVLVPASMTEEMMCAAVQAVYGKFNSTNKGGQPCYTHDIAPKANLFANHVMPQIWSDVLKAAQEQL